MQQPKTKVYLAGGLRSNWQTQVINACGDKFVFYNPSEHNLEMNSVQYTAWDIFHVKQSDIVFAYMEVSNPSGYGLALEVGYAKALNKTVILINERSSTDQQFDRYFKIIENMSDVVFDNFQDGLAHLLRYN